MLDNLCLFRDTLLKPIDSTNLPYLKLVED